MFLLGIKFITWYLYNFKGMTVFSGLLFQYSEGWTRNGFMRMDTGALFGIVLCVTLYYCFVKKQLLYWLVLAFLYVYLIFVTQYRFQIIVTIILTAYGYYCSTDSNRKKNIKLMAISFIIIAFVLFGFSGGCVPPRPASTTAVWAERGVDRQRNWCRKAHQRRRAAWWSHGFSSFTSITV